MGADGSGTAAAAASTNQVVSYTAVLAVQNPDLKLRPGMTATAAIVTETVRGQVLVPNEALRWKPEVEEEGGLFGGPDEETQQVRIGRGASGTVYVKDAESQPKEVRVRVGVSDGTRTVVTGGLSPGQAVIVGPAGGGRGAAGQRDGSRRWLRMRLRPASPSSPCAASLRCSAGARTRSRP